MKVLDRDLVSGENKFKKQNLSKAQGKKIRSKTHKKIVFLNGRQRYASSASLKTDMLDELKR